MGKEKRREGWGRERERERGRERARKIEGRAREKERERERRGKERGREERFWKSSRKRLGENLRTNAPTWNTYQILDIFF